MRNDILSRVAADLLSIPPFISRGVRRKLLKMTLADAPNDITPLHFDIIRLLEEEGTQHIAEICTKLHIAKAQMTPLLDKLAACGVVTRVADPADRRTINISLTVSGRRFLDEHKGHLQGTVQEYMSCLNDEELEELSASLRKVKEILSRLEES